MNSEDVQRPKDGVETRKDEDGKCDHLQCVLGQTLAVEVSAGRFFCCATSPGGLQNLFGSPGSGDPNCATAPAGCLNECTAGAHYLSPILVMKTAKYVRRNNFKGYASEKNDFS